MKATKSPARTHRTATASVIWHWPTMWTHEQQESSNRTCWNRHIAWCARVVCSMVCVTRSHVIPRSGRTATGPRSHMQRILISSSLSHRHTTHMWTHRGTATCTCVARTHDSGASCVCGFTFYFFSAFFFFVFFVPSEWTKWKEWEFNWEERQDTDGMAFRSSSSRATDSTSIYICNMRDDNDDDL